MQRPQLRACPSPLWLTLPPAPQQRRRGEGGRGLPLGLGDPAWHFPATGFSGEPSADSTLSVDCEDTFPIVWPEPQGGRGAVENNHHPCTLEGPGVEEGVPLPVVSLVSHACVASWGTDYLNVIDTGRLCPTFLWTQAGAASVAAHSLGVVLQQPRSFGLPEVARFLHGPCR